MANDPVIYEVNLAIAPARGDEFDAWLQDHVQAMLELPGFTGAQTLAVEPELNAPPDAPLRRTVQYRLTDRAALDRYFEQHAARMRADGVTRFGDDMSATRRILAEPVVPGDDVDTQHCANCAALLDGQYCSACGQRHRTRMISVWELLRAAFDDILSWDSRVWRTLRPLLFSPGKLTSEYLAGRRVHYTPPVRMYLVLSLSFFVLSQLTALDDFHAANMLGIDENEASIDLTFSNENRENTEAARERLRTGRIPIIDIAAGPDPEADSTPDATPDTDTPDPAQDESAPSFADELATDLRDELADELAAEFSAEAADDTATSAESEDEASNDGDEDEDDRDACDFDDADINIPGLDPKATNERIRQICRRITSDEGRVAFTESFADIAPNLLIVLLPFIALAGKLFYPLSRRYYVEHLLYYTHFHSFLFLLLILLMFLSAAAPYLPVVSINLTYAWIAATVYTVYYVYRSLRLVFRQGRIATLFKMFLIWMAYLFLSSILLAIGAALAALSL
ncbi:MAG: DUF4286 family protein [Pseudomonadota bacterium]